MDFFEATNERRSVRAFKATPVEETKLQQILEAANRAPSAGNLQAFEIYVVRRPDLRQELARAALSQEFIAQAPLSLVFCAHPARSAPRYRMRGVSLYALQDATIACTFAMLAATALGLGSVWVGAFDEKSVRRVIGVDDGLRPVAILPLGYADERPGASSRRGLDALVHEVGRD
jgi:nitroreductase